MSDDEDYYDWDEEYLYELGDPDFVDDLAAGSHHDTLIHEALGFEEEDYFSDWEYYSDDYYDDDPTVAQSTLRAKSEPATKTKMKEKTTKSRTRPRTNSALKPHSHHPLNVDATSFQGVVWRTSSMEPDFAVQIYQPGQSDKVALLEDWREIFKSAQPALDKSRLRKRKRRVQESQTADLSVAETEVWDGDEEDSSDAMSDVLSMDQTSGSVDAGEASNTTPEMDQSPKEASTIAVETPVKRGRKRKAEAPATETKPGKEDDKNTRSRSKRVAVDKSEDDGLSSGPVRRSARQKK